MREVGVLQLFPTSLTSALLCFLYPLVIVAKPKQLGSDPGTLWAVAATTVKLPAVARFVVELWLWVPSRLSHS